MARGDGMAPLDVPPGGMPGFERKPVSMVVLDQLRDGILRGEHLEGTPLRQDALAAQLGVPRLAVREALRQLEAEGLVTFNPHVGAVVSTLSLEEIKELFELRALIEADLLQRAIPLMRADHLQRAHAVLEEFAAACRRGDIEAWGTLNRDFHSILLEPAAQPLTMGVLRYLHNQTNRYTSLHQMVTRSQVSALAEHEALLDAVARREVRHACALLVSHILGAARALSEFLHRQRSGVPVRDAGEAG
jgi:DNA-binding GntR family transcriptional regulator